MNHADREQLRILEDYLRKMSYLQRMGTDSGRRVLSWGTSKTLKDRDPRRKAS
jgi:hypothetical protein